MKYMVTMGIALLSLPNNSETFDDYTYENSVLQQSNKLQRRNSFV